MPLLLCLGMVTKVTGFANLPENAFFPRLQLTTPQAVIVHLFTKDGQPVKVPFRFFSVELKEETHDFHQIIVTVT